jgi:hypothetical protein
VGHWRSLFRPKPHVVFQKNDIRVPRDFVKRFGVGPSRNEDDDAPRRSRQPFFVGLPHKFIGDGVGRIAKDRFRVPRPRDPIILLKKLASGGDQRVGVRARVKFNLAKNRHELFNEIWRRYSNILRFYELPDNGFSWPNVRSDHIENRTKR